MFDTDAGFQGFNLYVYCGNNPVGRIDVSGTDSSKIDEGDITDDEFKTYGGGNGCGAGSPPVTPSGRGNMWLELFDMLKQAFKDGLGGCNGVYRSSYSSTCLFLPDEYYNKHAPKLYTPNSEYTNWKYNPSTGEYEYSTVYYDYGGRQVLRVDWTNHGRTDHTNPHVHFTFYDGTYPLGIGSNKFK